MARRAPRSDARANRASIVAAAARQLEHDGELSMGSVAAAAGVGRSTLYRHFPTRPSLEEALREDALAEAKQLVESTLAERRPPLAVLSRVVTALVEIGSRRRLDDLGAGSLRE